MKVKLDPDWSVPVSTVSGFLELLGLMYPRYAPIEIDYQGPGWYHLRTGTILIIRTSDPRYFECHFWINDPRPRYRKLLGVEDVG